MTLRGRAVVITGASQGFGRAVARACIEAGADVMLCARGAATLESARLELAALATAEQRVLTHVMDASRANDVREMFEQVVTALPNLTGLVNNAGVYGPKGLIEENDWDEWVAAISINLMGTVLPCREAVAFFRRRGYGKIVNLSGGGATMPLPRFSAYAASKAAVVRFTETLAHETMGSGIDVNAVAPGALNTRLLDEVLEAGPEKVGADFYERARKQKDQGGAPLDRGAALCVFLLSALSDGISGKLISAIWDKWAEFPLRTEELSSTDVYTLRRIVPKDRGFDWE